MLENTLASSGLFILCVEYSHDAKNLIQHKKCWNLKREKSQFSRYEEYQFRRKIDNFLYTPWLVIFGDWAPQAYRKLRKRKLWVGKNRKLNKKYLVRPKITRDNCDLQILDSLFYSFSPYCPIFCSPIMIWDRGAGLASQLCISKAKGEAPKYVDLRLKGQHLKWNLSILFHSGSGSFSSSWAK